VGVFRLQLANRVTFCGIGLTLVLSAPHVQSTVRLHTLEHHRATTVFSGSQQLTPGRHCGLPRWGRTAHSNTAVGAMPALPRGLPRCRRCPSVCERTNPSSTLRAVQNGKPPTATAIAMSVHDTRVPIMLTDGHVPTSNGRAAALARQVLGRNYYRLKEELCTCRPGPRLLSIMAVMNQPESDEADSMDEPIHKSKHRNRSGDRPRQRQVHSG
jgi:hypothetical protein